MRNSIFIFLVLIYFVSLISCKNYKKEILIQENTLVFNEALNTDYILLNYSDVFDSVKVIPLELSEKSMINTIDQAFYTEEEIIVRDGNRVLVFHQNGDFIRQIGNVGRGPNEFIQIQEINFDAENNKIFVLDSQQKKIIGFDIEGRLFIETKVDFFEPSLGIKSFHYLPDGFLIEIIPYHIKSPVLMKIGFDGKIEESFLDDQAIHTAVRYSSSSFYKSDDGIIFFNTYSDIIYEYKKNNILSKFKINSIEKPNPEVQSKAEWKISRGEINENGYSPMMKLKSMHGLHDYWESERYISFKYIAKGYAHIGVIYDKNTGALRKGYWKDDMFNNFTFDNHKNFRHTELVKEFVPSYMPDKIGALRDTIRLVPFLVEDETATQRIMNLNEESNPVIVVYKAKKITK